MAMKDSLAQKSLASFLETAKVKEIASFN